ncbi:MAG: NAD-dependent epimerase/dehydratase family protein [Betaproteobacteria bacterium]
MRILVLGGTRFFGSFFTELALSHGHSLTVMHRGQSNAGAIAGAEQILADRRDGHALLTGRSFDAVLDTSGYSPAVVGDAARALQPGVPRYLFISSISAYAIIDAPGVNEDSALATLPPEVEAVSVSDLRWTVDMAHYGGLKAAAERAVLSAFGEQRTTIVRPGLIVGPRDPTDRFNYWVTRMAEAPRVLAPAPPEAETQVIDARDLAALVLGLVERAVAGTFNATGDATPMSAMLDGIGAGVESSAKLAWVAPEFLLAQGVEPWSELPLWLPADSGGTGDVSNSRGHAEGLSLRPLADTARDTLAWLRATPAGARPKRTSMAAHRERDLLALWDRGASSRQA